MRWTKSILLATLASLWQISAADVPAKGQMTEVELVSKADGRKIASFCLDREHLALGSEKEPESFISGPDGFLQIFHGKKTYHEFSYDEYLAAFGTRNNVFKQMRNALRTDLAKLSGEKRAIMEREFKENLGSLWSLLQDEGTPEWEFQVTGERGTIAGFPVRKIVELKKGITVAEIWASQALLPKPLLDIGEKFSRLMPKKFWDQTPGGNIGLSEMATMFGIPLKIVYFDGDQRRELTAIIRQKRADKKMFMPPTGYRKVEKDLTFWGPALGLQE